MLPYKTLISVYRSVACYTISVKCESQPLIKGFAPASPSIYRVNPWPHGERLKSMVSIQLKQRFFILISC